MTDVEKTYPCALSKEGTATEDYCRTKSRFAQNQVTTCARVACASPWRFCPACILNRQTPVRTLQEGVGCSVHGDVKGLSGKVLRNTYYPRPKIRIQQKNTLAQEVHKKRIDLLRASEKLRTRVLAIIREKQKDLSHLSARLALRKPDKKDAALGAFDLQTYRRATIEDTVRDMRINEPHSKITLIGVSVRAARRLATSASAIHQFLGKHISKEEREQLGITPGSNSRASQDPTRFNFESFEKDFELLRSKGLESRKVFSSEQWKTILDRYRFLSTNQFWSNTMDPMEVSEALTFAFEKLEMTERELANLIQAPPVRVQAFLELGGLTEGLHGMLGPYVPLYWRIEFGRALRIARQAPESQIDAAKAILWSSRRWSYKIK